MDHAIEMREAIVQHLRESGAVAAIVGARVFGVEADDAAPVQWPFVRYGMPSVDEAETTGGGHGRSGSNHDITIHAFAEGPTEGPVSALARAIVRSLNGAPSLPLSGVNLQGIDWDRTDYIRDRDNPKGYHAIIRFRAVTTEDI